MYPFDILPEHVMRFMGLNPIYHFINYFRNLVLIGTVPGLWDNVVAMSFSAAALCFGTYVFMTKQDRFILYF